MIDKFNEEEAWYEPEECESCGCPAGDFGDEDWVNGTWVCPECGCPQ